MTNLLLIFRKLCKFTSSARCWNLKKAKLLPVILVKTEYKCSMISYVWLSLVVFSFIAAIINGTFYGVASIISSGTDAVQLCIAAGDALPLERSDEHCRETAYKSYIKAVFRCFSSLSAPQNNKHIMGPVSMNTANLLGLGNAATPLGIEAMKRMKVSPLDRRQAMR